TDFSYCFSKCSNLTEIPEALFANNINVAHFDYCFSGCSNLTGLAPSLWLRTNVTKYNTCFYGCTKLSNYEDIPYDWKGKYEEPTKIEMTLGSFMTSGPNFVMTGSVINSFIRFKTKEVVSVDLIIQQDTYTAKIIASDHDMVNLQGIILNGEPNVVVICNFPYIDENRNLGIDLKISNQSGKMVTISLADKNNAVRITDRDGSVISGYSESENVMIVNKTKSGTN
ncbi:MAG TPA: hypothetical protein PLA01_05185, partial [Acetivibrio sp.]|nr:hypothetical protein [Acetivibrio sp.]